MAVLPPGTILQLMYLRERLRKMAPGRFIEIGPGSGEISSLLLELGWSGKGYDLEPRAVERLNARFSRERAEGRYAASHVDYLALNASPSEQVDLIVSSMVMEHFNDELESQFMRRSHEWLNDGGLLVGLVPGSPAHWGIEDEIAGHCRRYTRAKLHTLATRNGWVIRHLAGLTYPVSNMLLPLSNFLVKRAEGSKTALSPLERTKASGIRNVQFKTSFPNVLSLVLNRHVLLPLHWLQKAFSRSSNTLVLYFEAVTLQRKSHNA